MPYSMPHSKPLGLSPSYPTTQVSFEGQTNAAITQKWEAATILTNNKMHEPSGEETATQPQDEFCSVGQSVLALVSKLKLADSPVGDNHPGVKPQQ